MIRNKEWPHYITTLAGKTGIKPILLVFNPEQIDKVIGEFINVLDAHGLYDNKGIWKAIQDALRLNVRQSTIFDKFKKDRTFISVRFQSVEKPRFASKSGLNLCQIMPLHRNHAQ